MDKTIFGYSIPHSQICDEARKLMINNATCEFHGFDYYVAIVAYGKGIQKGLKEGQSNWDYDHSCLDLST